MRRLTRPHHLPESLRRDWAELLAPQQSSLFDPAMTDRLPEPAARWLKHAIPQGAVLHTAVQLELHGRIKLGTWRPFTAVQALAPATGYIWAERTGLFGLPVTGYDRLTRGEGEMRHVLPGGIPLVHASGPDLTRSAAGRLAAETVLLPSAALDPGITWRQVGDSTVLMTVAPAGYAHEVKLTVGPAGELSRVSLHRWARLRRAPYRSVEFAVEVLHEADLGGLRIPAEISAGYTAEGPFIVQTVDRVVPGAPPAAPHSATR